MRMFDELHMIVTDHDFAGLFAAHGKSAEAPVRLASATLGQFMEGLTDRRAAHAVRTRIDWKYLLCLELSGTGFDHTVLNEFRSRLLEHGAEQRLFDAVLTLARTRGHALDELATCWRVAAGPYDTRVSEPLGLRFSEFHLPRSAAGRQAWAARTGTDGMDLLEALVAEDKALVLHRLPAVQTLRQVWIQNFLVDNPTDVPPCVLWRTNDNAPPAKRYIGSPYDTDARYAKKGAAIWNDCNLHLTQTCGEATPHLITNVQRAPAAVTGTIHAALAERGLLPSTHIARTDHSAYVNAELLVDARQRYGACLVGPTRGDNHWQLKNREGFAARNFGVYFDRQEATCPAGQTSTCWTTASTHSGKPVSKVKFSSKVCRRCPLVSQCTDSTALRRTICIREQAEFEAARCGARVDRVRRRETRPPGTPGVRVSWTPSPKRCVRMQRGALPASANSRRTWQNRKVAAAMNIVRLLRWLADEPIARSRHSAFVKLYRAVEEPILNRRGHAVGRSKSLIGERLRSRGDAA